MATKKPRGGVKVETKVINFPIPLSLHTQIRVAAAHAQMTLRDFIIRSMEEAVEKGGSPEKKN
jgi:hypothetical protein